MTQQTNYYPEGTSGAPGLGFIALSVTIDNYSGSWGWVPGAGRYVRPWTQGAVFSLGSTQVGDIEWQTPPNISPAPVGNGQLTAIWSDIPPTSAMVSEGTGISVFSASTNPIPVAGSVAVPYNIGTSTQLLTIPSGIQTLAIYNPSISQALVLTVQGVQSGIYYARAYTIPQTFSGDLGEPLVVYLSPLDTQVSLTSVVGIRAAIITGFPSPLTPSPLEVSGISGAPVSVIASSPVIGLLTVKFDVDVTNTARTIIPGTGITVVTVYNLDITITSGTAGAITGGIYDTTGNNPLVFTRTAALYEGDAPVAKAFAGGYPLPAGVGVAAFGGTAGPTAQATGTVQYTQL